MNDIRPEDFDTVEEVSTAELDAVVAKMVKAREGYQVAKAQSDELYWHHENCRQEVMRLLEKAGKTGYEVEGVGKVKVVDKLKVKFPSDPEERKKFFDWMRDMKGEEAVLSYATVNYQSLNTLYNQEYEEALDKGNSETFSIPGLQPPQHNRELRFNKSRSN